MSSLPELEAPCRPSPRQNSTCAQRLACTLVCMPHTRRVAVGTVDGPSHEFVLACCLLQRIQGDEVAVFAYGGSIMTTIFGHGAIAFDDDLVTHSRNNAETLVTLGSSLGRSTGHPHTHAPAGPA